MAKHLLHLGFLLAVGALALKAAFMPPRLQASLRPGEHAMLGGDILVLKGFSVPKYPSGKPRQYESDVHVVSMARGTGEAAARPKAVHAKISVNHPMRWKGWWIYQNSYDAAEESAYVFDGSYELFEVFSDRLDAAVIEMRRTACQFLKICLGFCSRLAAYRISTEAHDVRVTFREIFDLLTVQ